MGVGASQALRAPLKLKNGGICGSLGITYKSIEELGVINAGNRDP